VNVAIKRTITCNDRWRNIPDIFYLKVSRKGKVAHPSRSVTMTSFELIVKEDDLEVSIIIHLLQLIAIEKPI
jgi:hypothetical protein